jgi:diguanylate cyclase (GGDEF)-like protein
MVAHIDGRTVTVGTVPPAQIVTKLLTRLCADEVPAEFISDELPRRFDEFTSVAEYAAGVLALPLSAGYQDYVLWFRGEWVHDRRWAGDPDKPMTGHPNSSTPDELGPRKSFAAWTQHVRGRCRPWLAAEIETARSLASAVPDLQLTRAHERLAHRALHDPLTGLPNQAMLLARTDPALERQGDGEGAVALLVIDLDHFGQVNETLGYSTGDRLLGQVAIRLAATLAGVGSLAHAGGDDFIVLCEGVSVEGAAQLANRIVQDFRQPFLIAGHRILATASIGFAVASGDATAAGLLRDADTAMSRMKRWGRNGAVHFSA